MSILSHDTFWNAVVTMPMTKKMLQLSLKKCGACGRTVLEAALDDYAGKTERHCEKCSGLYSQIIGFWIEFLRKSLNFKREKIENIAILLKAAINAKSKVGLKMNIKKENLESILKLLPAEKSPTISNLVDSDFVAIDVIVDDKVERSLVPALQRAGASGIISYPLNKVIH